jgi:hypothetical protein
MKEKYIVMTASEIDKKYPLDRELFRRLKALQDADIEPYMDEDSPELPDSPEKPESIFTRIFNRLRSKPKQPQPQASLP